MYRIIFFIILAGNTPYSRTLYPVRHIRASDDSGDDYSYETIKSKIKIKESGKRVDGLPDGKQSPPPMNNTRCNKCVGGFLGVGNLRVVGKSEIGKKFSSENRRLTDYVILHSVARPRFCANCADFTVICVAGSTEASDVTLTADPLPDKESCARLNGVCAEIGNCPRGSKIEIRGLCPDEDDNDMECCIPYKRQSRCCHTRSACVPKVFECSQHYRIYEKIYMAT